MNPEPAMGEVKNNQIYTADFSTCCSTKALEFIVTVTSGDENDTERDKTRISGWNTIISSDSFLYSVQTLPCLQRFLHWGRREGPTDPPRVEQVDKAGTREQNCQQELNEHKYSRRGALQLSSVTRFLWYWLPSLFS